MTQQRLFGCGTCELKFYCKRERERAAGGTTSPDLRARWLHKHPQLTCSCGWEEGQVCVCVCHVEEEVSAGGEAEIEQLNKH